LIVREDMERLEQVLDGNAELQKLILEYCQLHMSLHCDVRSKKAIDKLVESQGNPPTVNSAVVGENTATFPTVPLGPIQSGVVGEPVPLPRSQPGHSFGSGLGLTVWPMLLMFCLGIAVTLVGMGITRRADERRPTSVVMPAAFLTSSTGCAWGAGSSKLQTVGSSVDLGDEISLQEGIAEFRLASGVYVSAEGPAGIVLTAPDSMVLQYGKITTHVPWPVSEFKIWAGTVRLSANDSEFGVSVTGGRVEAHVFSGEVLIANALLLDGDADEIDDRRTASSHADRDILTEAVIEQGRSVFISHNKNNMPTAARWDKASRALFANKLTMAGQLPITSAYCDAVRGSRPFGYWRFEVGKNGVVRSETSDAPDLSIVGDLRLSGLSANRVAEFRPGSDCYLVSREPLDALAKSDYTAEIWVKPSHTHCGAVLGLCATDPVTSREKNAFLLELQDSGRQQVRGKFAFEHPGAIRFLHRDPPLRTSRAGTSCFSRNQYSILRWQHVVAVKRGERMELYIDGRLRGQAEDKTLLAENLHLVVGRQEPTGRPYQFIGQLDELAIYPRALEPAEIKAHFEAVDWKQLEKPEGDPEDI
jgi:hypothetical protein